MTNIPEVKLGIIAVSRDCFPIALSTQRRKNLAAACKGNFYECPVTVENETDMLKAVEDADFKRIFITHSPCEDGMAQYAAEMLREYGHFREILETTAGGTICVHCGPNTLGILFMRKSKK